MCMSVRWDKCMLYIRFSANQLSKVVLQALFFFFNDTATTEIYTLSLHDALPIYVGAHVRPRLVVSGGSFSCEGSGGSIRSEEHTSELQSQSKLVCRLLL